MIRRCDEQDFESICDIINDGALAYRGVIPADCSTDPYMARDHLRAEVRDGVVFWGYERNGKLVGVMGIQELPEVTLIRHAYVRTDSQRSGIGGVLLSHLRTLAGGPLLIGTWADASWAIRFYQRHGFRLVSGEEKGELLKRFWKISERQSASSVVLADANWPAHGH